MKTTRIRIVLPKEFRCISIPSNKNVPLTVNFDKHQVIGAVDLNFDDEGELYAEIPNKLLERFPRDSTAVGASGEVDISSSKAISFKLNALNFMPKFRDRASADAVGKDIAKTFSNPDKINANAIYLRHLSETNQNIFMENLGFVIDRIAKKLKRREK